MYVQLDADYYDHPKTLHLIGLIGPEADTYPPRLWTWALKYAKNGVLRSNAMIEVACRWRGEPGKLAAAMMTAGFVDMDGLTLHGWMERTGSDILRYEEKKSRLREKYRNSSGRFRESSAVSELNGTELNGTKRNGPNEGPSPTRGSVGERRVSNTLSELWNDGPGEHLNGKSAAEKIQAAIDVGVEPQAIEQAFWDHKRIKGRKIWEVLDPMRPKEAPPFCSVQDVIDEVGKKLAKEKRA